MFIFCPVTLSKLSSYSECRHALANTPDCFPLFLEVMSKHRHRQVSPAASSCLCKPSPSGVIGAWFSSLPPACLPSDCSALALFCLFPHLNTLRRAKYT